MTILAARQGDVSMPDAVSQLDLDAVANEIGDKTTREIAATAFLRYLADNFGYTFEYARTMLYKLIDAGRVVLTDTYTLRVAG